MSAEPLGTGWYLKPITLDTADGHIPDLLAHGGDHDGRGIDLTITQGGEPVDTTGMSVWLEWRHQATRGQGFNSFEDLDADGRWQVTYPSAMLHPGDVVARIGVYQSEERDESTYITGSKNFRIHVQESPIDPDAMEGNNDFTVFHEAAIALSGAAERAEAAADAAEADAATAAIMAGNATVNAGAAAAANAAASAASAAAGNANTAATAANAAAAALAGVSYDVLPLMTSLVRGGAQVGPGLAMQSGALGLSSIINPSGQSTRDVPDYSLVTEVDVPGVTEQFATTGAQLLDTGKLVESGAGFTYAITADGGISISGTASRVYDYVLNGLSIAFSAGASFVFSLDKAEAFNVYFHIDFDDTTTLNKVIVAGETELSFTPTKSGTITTLSLSGLTTGTQYNTVIHPMLNAGSTALPWEPYTGAAPSPSPDYPQAISSITEATLRWAGRNLLKPATSENLVLSGSGRASVSDGIIKLIPDTTSAVAKFKSEYLLFEDFGEGSFTVSCDVMLSPESSSYTESNFAIYLGFSLASRKNSVMNSSYDRYKGKTIYNSSVPTQWTRISTTFVVPDDITTGPESALVPGSYLCVEVYAAASKKPILVRNVQLERGSVAHDFEPWTGGSSQISLSSNVIASLPDGTHDELVIERTGTRTGSVTLVKNTEMVEVADTDVSSVATSGHTDVTHVVTSHVTKSDYRCLMSNKFRVYNASFSSASTDTELCGVYYTNGTIRFNVANSRLSAATSDGVKAWLTTAGLEFLYCLLTPTTTDLGTITLPAVGEAETVWLETDLDTTPTVVWRRGMAGLCDWCIMAIGELQEAIADL